MQNNFATKNTSTRYKLQKKVAHRNVVKAGRADREARNALIKLCGKKKINATNRYFATAQRKLRLCAGTGPNGANGVARSSTAISAQLKAELDKKLLKRSDECNICTYMHAATAT